MTIFVKIIECALNPGNDNQPKYLLTPLAKRIYCDDDIDALAIELKKEVGTILKIVICSADRDGLYLPYSNVDCAVACAIVAIKNKTMRENIIDMVIRKYFDQGKTPNGMDFLIYYKHYPEVLTT